MFLNFSYDADLYYGQSCVVLITLYINVSAFVEVCWGIEILKNISGIESETNYNRSKAYD